MSQILDYLLSCLPQRRRSELEALAARLEALGATPECLAAGEIPPGLSPRQRTALELAAEVGPCVDLPWRGALHLAGGTALVRRARDAGIDSPEALARLSSGDVARLGGWGRVRLQQLRRAALSVGLDWAPDLERGPGRPGLSSDGESPRESVSLPAPLRAQVRGRARAEGISASAWIRRAVEAALSG